MHHRHPLLIRQGMRNEEEDWRRHEKEREKPERAGCENTVVPAPACKVRVTIVEQFHELAKK